MAWLKRGSPCWSPDKMNTITPTSCSMPSLLHLSTQRDMELQSESTNPIVQMQTMARASAMAFARADALVNALALEREVDRAAAPNRALGGHASLLPDSYFLWEFPVRRVRPTRPHLRPARQAFPETARLSNRRCPAAYSQSRRLCRASPSLGPHLSNAKHQSQFNAPFR